MTSTTIYYRCVDDDDDDDDETRYRLTVDGRWSFDRGWESRVLAQEAASHYHSKCGGWESSWPRVFALYATEEGEEVARFSVHVEAVPTFHASPA